MRAHSISSVLVVLLAGSGLLGCGLPPGSGVLQSALGGDGGAQFENVPPDDNDPFAMPQASPAVASRLHSCQKLSFQEIGNLLTSRGVNLDAVAGNGAPPTAGQVYRVGASILGAPNYAARTREAVRQTTSGATKLMDVFLMAAPEIIAAMPNVAACKINGTPAVMFNNDNTCNATGIMCLTGMPATQAQIDLCSQVLKDVPSATGKQIAVAAILSAAHTCE
jgi:hypothetical protein